MAAGVHAAGRDLVQQRLPDVRARTVDQGDLGLALFAELVAELRRKLESTGAAADDDDLVQLRRRVGNVGAAMFILASCTQWQCRRRQERSSPPVTFLTSATIFWVIVSIA